MSQLLSFDTLPNTRDLGGMRTADGRRIKDGRLIRSGRLSDMNSSDREALSDLVGTVIDFRDEAERMERPDQVLPGVDYITLPILEGMAFGVTRDKKSERQIFSVVTENPENALKMVGEIYTNLVMQEYPVSQYRRFLDILLKDHEKAVLWHCSGGKDRAGIASVIIEEILGVPREDIIADYMKTNVYLADDTARMIQYTVQSMLKGGRNGGLPEVSEQPENGGSSVNCGRPEIDKRVEDALMCLFCAKQEYINAFYAAAEKKYGGIDGYLHEGLKLTDEEIDRLKEMYLEDGQEDII